MSRTERVIGDIVEIEVEVLVDSADPDRILLAPGGRTAEPRRFRLYQRIHPGGVRCQGHQHETIDEAQGCNDPIKQGGVWLALARAVADSKPVQRRHAADDADPDA